jgi:hypothetical protein
VILNEGAPTVTASGSYFGGEGQTEKVLTWANQIAEGNLVAIAVETWNTWVATEGAIVVEKPTTTEVFVIGRVASTPKLVNMPADTAAGDSPAKQLAGGYFRTARIELMAGITALLKAEVRSDGSTAVTVGSTGLLKTNIVSDYADDDTTEIKLQAAASAGTGLIALHHCAAGSAGDTLNCLVGVTGLMTAITGA